MKIVVVGATGTIGGAVVSALEERGHEVIGVSRRAEIAVDLSDPKSIKEMYEVLDQVDAVVCTAGDAKFGKLDELSDKDFALGLGSKLMGQVNLVRFGRSRLRNNGSFTLTSGILADQPHPASVMLTMINAGVEGFGRAASLNLEHGQRVNVVSPPMVKETAIKLGWGGGGMPAAEVARGYVESVESNRTGEVIRPHEVDWSDRESE